jgi:amidase
MPIDPWLDATAQAELVRNGEVTARELVDAALARIEAVNPKLNAVIHRRDAAARREADAVRAGSGPFAGVPFLAKDLLCLTEGDPLHMGTRFLRDLGLRAPHDSFLTTKFRTAGFVFVGRTNTPELGTLPTTEPDAYGPTHNPWDPTRSPGGSSGGSAAAVAAGLVPAAHGNDGGGSIRIPASACGLVGLKPSRGRTSLGPDVGEVSGGLVCEGALTRSVRDTAAILDAIWGPMPGDPYTAPPSPTSYLESTRTRPRGLRIGVMTRAPGNRGTVHPECVAAVERAATLLLELGHVASPDHPSVLDDPQLVHTFSTMYAVSYAHQLDAFGALAGRPLEPEDVDLFNWMLAEFGRAVRASEYLGTLDWIHGYRRQLAAWWAGTDLLLTPTLPEPPVPLGTFAPTAERVGEVAERATAFSAFTSPFNLSGHPAISLPLHWTPGGLPVGVQLVAPYGREDLLLAVAAALEEAAPWAHRRPVLHA